MWKYFFVLKKSYTQCFKEFVLENSNDGSEHLSGKKIEFCNQSFFRMDYFQLSFWYVIPLLSIFGYFEINKAFFWILLNFQVIFFRDFGHSKYLVSDTSKYLKYSQKCFEKLLTLERSFNWKLPEFLKHQPLLIEVTCWTMSNLF